MTRLTTPPVAARLMPPSESAIEILLDRLRSSSYASGSTHDFYHYPARFAPAVARAVIDTWSGPGDWVLDPFMGGGTTVIEALRAGRRVVGVDLNSLAHFVAEVRTRPIFPADERAVERWATELARRPPSDPAPPNLVTKIRNLPAAVAAFTAAALRRADRLRFPRRRRFARMALLKLGQWALDGREFAAPTQVVLARRLPGCVAEMIDGLRSLVTDCAAAGIRKRSLVGRRVLLNRSAVGLENEPTLLAAGARPRLVFTSPPYPGVHVLYHRWQYRGRRETAAPYWIANVLDGAGESYYTGGSRTPTGVDNYFRIVTAAFRSVREIVDAAAVIVQLVGFADPIMQLARYRTAMREAGFREMAVGGHEAEPIVRRIPNRKWYHRVRGERGGSAEFLLVHRPC